MAPASLDKRRVSKEVPCPLLTPWHLAGRSGRPTPRGEEGDGGEQSPTDFASPKPLRTPSFFPKAATGSYFLPPHPSLPRGGGGQPCLPPPPGPPDRLAARKGNNRTEGSPQKDLPLRLEKGGREGREAAILETEEREADNGSSLAMWAWENPDEPRPTEAAPSPAERQAPLLLSLSAISSRPPRPTAQGRPGTLPPPAPKFTCWLLASDCPPAALLLPGLMGAWWLLCWLPGPAAAQPWPVPPLY